MLSTSLYFVVFGAAIGGRMGNVDGVRYGSFIVPGLIMLSILTESVSNASFGIYLPKCRGTIFELLSAPVSYVEVLIGYVGAAATKSVMLGVLILATARAVRAVRGTASGVDGGLPGADGAHFQHARLHHRPLGRQLRAAAVRAAAGA